MENWERVLSLAIGAGALASALSERGRGGMLAAVSGAALVGRGVTGYCPVNAAIGRRRRNDDTRRALGGSRGIFVRESITVDAAPETLYALWREAGNLTLLPSVERIDVLDENRWRWTITGPAGVRLSWDAEIISDVPGELIGWRSLEGADVASAGSVTFRPLARGGTLVTVTMQFNPPAGKAGAVLATVLGRSPARDVREALRRWKQMVETGAR
jgi:uncharacterized membrane protein